MSSHIVQITHKICLEMRDFVLFSLKIILVDDRPPFALKFIVGGCDLIHSLSDKNKALWMLWYNWYNPPLQKNIE